MLTAALAASLAALLWPVRSAASTATAAAELPTATAGTATPAHAWQKSDYRTPTGRLTAQIRRCLHRRRLDRRRAADPWVADFAEVVAVGLDAGLDLPAAALASARSPGVVAGAPWLAGHLRDCVEAGWGVTRLLETDADVSADERGDLGLLVAAWTLTERVGAAASTVTASAAASIRERHGAADRKAVVVAGPRASMVLLSALPLAGPAVAALVGMPPARLYESGASRVLAATGVLLTVLGWRWAGTLLRRAGRPGCTDEPAP